MKANTLRAVLLVPVVALTLSTVVHGQAPTAPQGVITAREFLDIGGTDIPALTNNAKFPNNYDIEGHAVWFEWPAGDDDGTPPVADVKNNYGTQILGYFYPETTGPHTFYLAADDNARLYLSTDSSPANKKLIAFEPEWNPVRDFLGTARRDPDNPQNVSSSFQGSEWPGGGAAINLTAGQAYYIEALAKEGGTGDNLAVSIDGELPIPGSRLSTIDKTSGPVTITTQPASQTVNEGQPVNFTVAVNGTPRYTFQWTKGGVDIPDATAQTYTIPNASVADAGQYTVVVTGGAGAPVTSAAATLTVNADTAGPTLVSAIGGGDFRSVTVTFSERVDQTTAEQSGNYQINNGVTVSSAVLLTDTSVHLTTSQQGEDQVYTLTVSNVRDRAAVPNTIAANSTINFNSAKFTSGFATWKRWQDVEGDTASIDVFASYVIDPSFRPPDATGVAGFLGAPRDVADNYGAQAYAFFVPPTTGNYVFFMACDDQGYLYLSPDANPANKKLIATMSGWSAVNQWINPAAGVPEDVRSDTYAFTEWETGGTITLTAGNRYYIELLFREGGGGDGGEVYYKLASDPDPTDGTLPNTTGAVIGSFLDPNSLTTTPPIITQAPTGIVYTAGQTVTFSVGVSSALPVTYQWAKGGVAIPGATSSSLVFPNADHTVIGDYSVTVSNDNGSVNTLPDNNVRALMRGAFLIEAEDYNHSGGQTVAAASTMPYAGDAYLGLVPILDVDFSSAGDRAGGGALAYQRHTSDDLGVVETKGPADPADYLRGDFSVTANYALGWTVVGDWQNYTRTFPQGNYVAYLAGAHDGRAANEINMKLSKVANPTIPDGSQTDPVTVEGGQQGLTHLGTFLGPGTGAWSSNDFYPLRAGDGTGDIVQFPLNGAETLRLTFNATDGDADYILLYNVGATPTGPRFETVTLNGTQLNLTWTGAGTLQSSTSAGPGSSWAPVAGATGNSYSTTVAPGQIFYRIAQ